MNENFSRLLDGDLAGSELDRTIGSLDAEGLRSVERYQMIGALMRRDCSDAAVSLCRNSVSARISGKIGEEPAWLLPSSRRTSGAADSGGVRRLGAFVGGFAAAAAIAVVAVMAVGPDPFHAEVPAVGPVAALDAPAKSGDSAMDRDALDALLVEHGEFTGSAGLNGLVAYAKFVSSGAQ
jgi:hypothetical protein